MRVLQGLVGSLSSRPHGVGCIAEDHHAPLAKPVGGEVRGRPEGAKWERFYSGIQVGRIDRRGSSVMKKKLNVLGKLVLKYEQTEHNWETIPLPDVYSMLDYGCWICIRDNIKYRCFKALKRAKASLLSRLAVGLAPLRGDGRFVYCLMIMS